MILYLHGYNGTYDKASPRVELLRCSGHHTVYGINYDSSARRGVILSTLLDAVRPGTVAVAGNSLGGYFAASVASILELRSVLINPALSPYHFLQSIGESARAASYKDSWIPLRYKFPPCVLLDDGDEVFCAVETAEYFRGIASPLQQYSGGCHAFSHTREAADVVAAYLKQL